MRPFLPLLLLATLTPPALAQSILPAADGTGTLVLPDGSTYTITGGTLSGDGANLFHSFEQFGLTSNQVANFLADPTIQNILGRVMGGNASLIDGQLQVSGSRANLYLINPAGILFGPNSVLNLEGSFTATTASGIGFGENWLRAMGDNDYTPLWGNPTAFRFSPGAAAVINGGHLAVQAGERLTLAGGAVINLGTLQAPGGEIIVLAVPGENLIRLRPVGARLGLELATLPETTPTAESLPFSPLDIPSLLRAGAPELATGVTVNADGTVSLTGSSAALPTATGTTVVSGTIEVGGGRGGTVQVLGDRVAVIAATIDASGTQGGGRVWIGGDYRGGGTAPSANRTYLDAHSTITANALETGNGGEIIVWADEGTRFDGTITAQGGAAGGDGGFVEVSGRDTLAFTGRVDVSAAHGAMGTLVLDPTNILIDFVPPSSPGVDASLPDILAAELPGDIVINSTVLENQVGNVVLEATNNITLAPGVSLNFLPGGSITFTADADGDLAGAFTMDPTQAINARGTDTTNGRNIAINGASVTVGAINTNVPIVGPANATNAGSIAITSTNGGIATGNLDSRVCNGFFCTGNAGHITLSATGGGIATGNLTTYAANGAGGAVSLTTDLGDITTGNIVSDSFGPGGNVTIATASGNVTVGEVNAVSGQSTAGNIELRAGNGLLQVNDDVTARTNTGTAGNITLAGNEINLLLDAFSTVRSQGTLVIEPGSLGQAIALGGVGDTGPGVLDFTATDLARLANGFSRVTLGSGTGTGPISLAGNVTLSDPVTLVTNGSIDTTGGTLSGTDNASLTLEAGTGMTAGAMSTLGQPVVITGDRNGDGFGPVAITQSIATGGGAVTVTGVSDDETGVRTVGTSTIDSGGGNITISGSSTGAEARGIELSGGLNSQGGSITLTGSSATERGIVTFGPVNSGGGAIVMNGTSTGTDQFARGIALVGPVNSAGGNVNLSGVGDHAGVSNFPGGTVDAGTGNLILATDNPLFLAPVLGSGALSIQPLNPALPITLGGTNDPTQTFLSRDEIAQLGDGFSSRTIGQSGHTGAITLEPFTISSPLTITGGVLTGPNQNTTWAVAPDGSLVIGGFGAPLRLLNPTEIIGGDDAINTVLGSSGNDTFTVTGPNAGRLENVRFSNISAFDGQQGFDTLGGTSGNDAFSITGSTSGEVQDINFINVEAIATGDGQDTVDLLPGLPLAIELSGGSGSLTLQSSGPIVLNANVTTPGDLAMLAGEGGITQIGGRVAAAGNTTLGASENINLSGGNDFNTVEISSGQNVVLNDINGIQLNNLTVAGGLQVTAGGNLTTADLTLPGAPISLQAVGAITSGNLSSRDTHGGDIRLQAGDRIQVNTLNAQGTNRGGSITAVTGSTFQALGSFIDQGGNVASLSTLGGTQGGPITLAYQVNRFILGDPSFNGSRAAITTGNVTLPPDPGSPIVGRRIFGQGQPGQVRFLALGNLPVEIEDPPGVLEVVFNTSLYFPETDEGLPVTLSSTSRVLLEEDYALVEETFTNQFVDYFGAEVKPPNPVSLAQAQAILRDIQAQTGEIPALLYVRFNRNVDNPKAGQGALELLLVTAEGNPTQVRVLAADPQAVIKTQELLRRQLTNPNLTNNTAYLPAAQQLYNWMIAPIRDELEAAGITNLGFVMDAGLRTLPLAALHDGDRFLIADYSLGLIPSLGLIDATYVDLNRQNSSLLVAGASQFINQSPLLAAQAEIQAIQAFWPGPKLTDTNFTVAAVQRARGQSQIIHLATHAQFLRGAPDQSYIQFFDRRLRLSQVQDLGLFNPPVDLVTLSACQTAMGNSEAELGFAGFALQAGARSALASLWQVSDEATAGLMTLFYQQLDQQPTKTEALRQAQLALVRGEVYVENGLLQYPGGAIALPPELVVSGRQTLNHPFYWSGFTVVGSPW
ncbi:MAG TPA: CHAT domain-containing protein [Leptolyngbyaceae cyanobacterium M65_K2018_010]|nr:CHAT domain-containing protein [Leptolyngbyaceae cyanobacterium M65_K2018_010]